jgi:hypothetical protein
VNAAVDPDHCKMGAATGRAVTSEADKQKSERRKEGVEKDGRDVMRPIDPSS